MNAHSVNTIRRIAVVRQGTTFKPFSAYTTICIAIVLTFLCGTPASAQRVKADGLSIIHSDRTSVDFEFNVDDIVLTPLGNGQVLLSSNAANSYSREAGKPQLPLYQQLFFIPDGVTPQLFIGDTLWERLTTTSGAPAVAPVLPSGAPAAASVLPSRAPAAASVHLSGVLAAASVHPSGKLRPASGARPKDESPQQPLPDSSVYGSGKNYGFPVATLTPMGSMRGYRVIQLTIAPFRYNAANNTLDVCRKLSASFSVSGQKGGHTFYASNLRELTALGLSNYIAVGLGDDDTKDYSNGMDSDEPTHLAIVAPQRFSNTLQPFVSWKRQEGYIVEEMYFDNADNHAIKAMLQQRYDESSADNPAPLYVLLVGDADDIPVWPARTHIEGIDMHSTDMPYIEYTGDSLPDALLGRIPARDTNELWDILSKTLDYEKALFSDTTYLHRSLLVAGSEWRDPAPTVTNGQVNYLKEQLLRIDPYHDTICYHNPGSDTCTEAIYGHLQQGNALVSYTAHCMAGGWRNPTIMNSMVDTLPEDGKPFLIVNNCCRSNAFSGDCFGEHLLRKANGGAIGAIGATNETLWDEDYYWSIGNRDALTLQPQYQADGCGAFDRMFHSHGEDYGQWAMTQSQTVAAGNWAVTHSGSPYWAFYWEIYCLLGDPTLMPYIGVPANTQLEIGQLQLNDLSATLNGTAHARVAATRNDTLVALCTLDGNGHGTMEFAEPVAGNILFTATAQYHRPVQQLVALGPQSISDIPEATTRIFPNPAKGDFTIDGLITPATITVYDLYGRKVKEYTFRHGETAKCDIRDLIQGVYLVSVDSGGTVTTEKLIVSDK